MARRWKLPGLLAFCVLLSSVVAVGEANAQAGNWQNTFTLTYEPTAGKPEYPKIDMGEVLARARFRLDSRRQCGDALNGVAVNARYCFDQADSSRNNWYPQGVSHVSDAYDAEAWTDAKGRVWKPLLVSWYRGESANTRSRITVVAPREAGRDPVYSHIELVRGAGASNVPIHAGGVAWYSRYLYVVDTLVGIRVFDLGDIRSKPGGGYVLPETGIWRAKNTRGTTGVCRGTNPRPRFSSVSVDRTSHRLLVGEFCGDASNHNRNGRVVTYRATGTLLGPLTKDAQVRPDAALDLPVKHVQGVASDGDRFYLNQSFRRNPPSTAPPTMYRAVKSGANLVVEKRIRGAIGGEDLSIERNRSVLWSVTEFQSRGRMIYNVRTGSF
jgi:hypothetical protein